MQHCLGASLMAEQCGKECAVLVADWQEEWQGDPGTMDYHNNKEGAACGQGVPEAIDCCDKKRQEGRLAIEGGDCK